MKKIELRDIAGGDFTYGERIQLARIFADEASDYEKIREVILCLHDIEIQPEQAADLAEYVHKILEDLNIWIKRESQDLYIPPTSEEVQADVEALTKACGDMGTVVTLAEEFQCSFDEIYNRPYLEVYTILKVRTERAKYDRRLTRVFNKKH